MVAERQTTVAEDDEDVLPRLVSLAWAGWSLEMPRQWQPLKLLGTPQKGNVIVGDTECAIFSVHWERPEGLAISEGDAWVAGRLKKMGLSAEPNPPAHAHFTASGWAHGVQTEEDKKTTYWYGYSAPAGLVLGVKVNGILPADIRLAMEKDVLPSLRTTPQTQAQNWSMYDISFQSPVHYNLKQRHLFSGDVALSFAKGSRDVLLLRQIYPGDLALKRRPFERWLDMRPFKEHRRLRRRAARTDAWSDREHRHLTGIVRHGRKQLGMPLGWCSPRWTCALAVHDANLNRLLIAEHLSAGAADQRMCERAIVRMNQARH
ncbi:MAG: hypothetical protein ACNA71_08100 [Kiritimatiellia bacterium]